MSLLQFSKRSYRHPLVVRSKDGTPKYQLSQNINRTEAIRRVIDKHGINTSPTRIREILDEEGVFVTNSQIQAAKKSFREMHKDEETRAEEDFGRNIESAIRKFSQWQSLMGYDTSNINGMIELLCTHILCLYHPDCRNSDDFDYDEFMVKLRTIIEEQVGG